MHHSIMSKLLLSAVQKVAPRAERPRIGLFQVVNQQVPDRIAQKAAHIEQLFPGFTPCPVELIQPTMHGSLGQHVSTDWGGHEQKEGDQ